LNHIEHIGIAVKSIDENQKIFEDLLGAKSYKEELVVSEGVRTAFFKIGESKIELLEATREDSPIAKFIEKKGEGMHHMAFAVDDIASEIKRLEKLDYRLLNKEPKKGADNKLIAFMHPKDTSGVLVELCQEISVEEKPD